MQQRNEAIVRSIHWRRLVPGETSWPALSATTLMCCAVAAYCIARVLFLRAIPMDSDEPQHAHVVWAWSQGLVPYRDVFDNHAPLFDLIFAPLMRRIGETPDVIAWLRLAMVPISTLAIATAGWLARALWGPRAALACVVLTATFPPYFLAAGEFRTDGLWALCWLATLLVAVSGRWSGKRAWIVGLMIGVCMSISMKSMLLLAGLVVAWLLLQASYLPLDRTPWKKSLPGAALMLCGALLVPALLVAIVHARGGLSAMAYDVWTHNLLPDVGRVRGAYVRVMAMAAVFALLFAGLCRHRAAVSTPLGRRRALVVLSAIAYVLLLLGIWPLLTRQDYLPVLPLLMLGLVAWWRARAQERPPRWPVVAAALIGIGVFCVQYPPASDRLAGYRASLATILAITSPREPVMDDKGAAVYRMRPFYFALEGITLARMRRGSIRDDIPQRLVDTDTHVVWMTRLPASDRAFIAANYVRSGEALDISGHDFGWLGANVSAPIRILMPGAYLLLGPASGGSIDGRQAIGPVWLAAGAHWLTSVAAGHYMLVWQPASALPPWGKASKT